ncbi:MAG: COX15/CtaA family protein [Pyrinomonadaceae bacterium MAG19_C2-C3]|nr:COX15/CtaA family protein [Pyrinomonadaceae bacterium MAG19_C2-C3]
MSSSPVLIKRKIEAQRASSASSLARFGRVAWVALAYNVLVILWGAGVRATGSGAGCGSHYPLCNGVVVPRDVTTETFIEFTHRLMSGAALLLILGLVVWAVRLVRAARADDESGLLMKAKGVRVWACVALFFTLTEAAIGAGLVIYELVAKDDSVARAVWLAIHLVNTFLLLGALTLIAWRASEWSAGAKFSWDESGNNAGVWLFAACLGLTLVLGASGAVTALGDTLFPVKSLAEGLQNDLTGTGHYLVQLRVLHPVIAGLVTVMLGVAAWWTIKRGASENPHAKKLAWVVVSILCAEVAAGIVNVLLLAPVWMQIVHLFLADMLWISVVILTAATCSRAPRHVPHAKRRADVPLDLIATPLAR